MDIEIAPTKIEVEGQPNGDVLLTLHLTKDPDDLWIKLLGEAIPGVNLTYASIGEVKVLTTPEQVQVFLSRFTQAVLPRTNERYEEAMRTASDAHDKAREEIKAWLAAND